MEQEIGGSCFPLLYYTRAAPAPTAALAAATVCAFCPRFFLASFFFKTLAIGERPATKPNQPAFFLGLRSSREFDFFYMHARFYDNEDAKPQKRPSPREMHRALPTAAAAGSLSDRHLTYSRFG